MGPRLESWYEGTASQDPGTPTLELVSLVPAMAGMYVGQHIRRKLSIEQFRLAVFWALLLTGLYTFASRVL